jgi:hypothetical protein
MLHVCELHKARRFFTIHNLIKSAIIEEHILYVKLLDGP